MNNVYPKEVKDYIKNNTNISSKQIVEDIFNKYKVRITDQYVRTYRMRNKCKSNRGTVLDKVIKFIFDNYKEMNDEQIAIKVSNKFKKKFIKSRIKNLRIQYNLKRQNYLDFMYRYENFYKKISNEECKTFLSEYNHYFLYIINRTVGTDFINSYKEDLINDIFLQIPIMIGLIKKHKIQNKNGFIYKFCKNVCFYNLRQFKKDKECGSLEIETKEGQKFFITDYFVENGLITNGKCSYIKIS